MLLTNPMTGQALNANPEGHNQYWNPTDANDGVPGRKVFVSRDGKYLIGRNRAGLGTKAHYLRSNRSGAILSESDDENELMAKAIDHEINVAKRKKKFGK